MLAKGVTKEEISRSNSTRQALHLSGLIHPMAVRSSDLWWLNREPVDSPSAALTGSCKSKWIGEPAFDMAPLAEPESDKVPEEEPGACLGKGRMGPDLLLRKLELGKLEA